MRGTTVLCGLLLLAACSCSCDDSQESDESSAERAPPRARELPTERLWTSTHFRYHSRAGDDSVCEPLLAHLEGHFSALQSYLGFAWPEGKQLDYFKYANTEDRSRNSACSPFHSSCFYKDVGIQTAEPIELHELVHAYLSPLGRSHVALEEGIANALSCGYQVRERPDAADLHAVFSSGGWSTQTLAQYSKLYDAAAWFVGWLLNEFGPEPFMGLYSTAKPSYDATALASAFEQFYAAPLDRAWKSAFESERPDGACVRVAECATPSWFDDAPPACEWPLFIRSLPLSEPSWVVERGSGFGQFVGACAGTAPPPHQAWLRAATSGHRGEMFATALRSGAYFVSQNPRFKGGSVQLFKSDLGLGTPNECPDLLPLTLDYRRNLTIAVQGDTGEDFTRMVRWVEADERQGGYSVQCAEGVEVKWCTSCGECTAACDKDVVVDDASTTSTIRTVEFTSRGEGAHWVRLTRTF